MQVAFFLIPKSEVVYIKESATVRQTLEKMHHHKYTAIPLLDDDGHYKSTVTVADLLWFIKDNNLSMETAEKVCIADIPKSFEHQFVTINATIQDLLSKAMNQNFIPVVDDYGIFIGIVRRREIIANYAKILEKYLSPEKKHQSSKPSSEENDNELKQNITMLRGC